MSEEEMLECISVTSKPMRLKGHLHICSVVECSTRNAKSKGHSLQFCGCPYIQDNGLRMGRHNFQDFIGDSVLIWCAAHWGEVRRLPVAVQGIIMAVGMADCIGWGSPRPPSALFDGHGGN
eukprot:scaffold77952_cov48-Cyclotella_meneghiniana.AAC.2